jgi:hypothetical protein
MEKFGELERECITDNSDTDRLIMSFLPSDKLLRISCLNKMMFHVTCNASFWNDKYEELMGFNPVDKVNLRRRYFKFYMNSDEVGDATIKESASKNKITTAVKIGDGQALQVHFNTSKVKKAPFIMNLFTNGNLEMVMFINENHNKYFTFDNHHFNILVKKSKLDIIEYLVESKKMKLAETHLMNCHNNLKVFKYLYNKLGKISDGFRSDLIKMVIKNNDLNIFKFLVSSSGTFYRDNIKVFMDYAITCNNSKIIDYNFEHVIDKDTYVVNVSNTNTHLISVCKFLHTNNIKFTVSNPELIYRTDLITLLKDKLIVLTPVDLEKIVNTLDIDVLTYISNCVQSLKTYVDALLKRLCDDKNRKDDKLNGIIYDRCISKIPDLLRLYPGLINDTAFLSCLCKCDRSYIDVVIEKYPQLILNHKFIDDLINRTLVYNGDIILLMKSLNKITYQGIKFDIHYDNDRLFNHVIKTGNYLLITYLLCDNADSILWGRFRENHFILNKYYTNRFIREFNEHNFETILELNKHGEYLGNILEQILSEVLDHPEFKVSSNVMLKFLIDNKLYSPLMQVLSKCSEDYIYHVTLNYIKEKSIKETAVVDLISHIKSHDKVDNIIKFTIDDNLFEVFKVFIVYKNFGDLNNVKYVLHALNTGRVRIAKLLFSFRGNLDQVPSKLIDNAFISAAANNDVEMIQILIKKKYFPSVPLLELAFDEAKRRKANSSATLLFTIRYSGAINFM